MAVTKIKAYHGDGAVENANDYIEDQAKTTLTDAERFEGAKGADIIENALSYAGNEFKTTRVADDGHTEILVSGHNCKPSLAKEAFKRAEDTYRRNGHSENAGKHYTKKTLLRAKLDEYGNPVLDKSGNMIHDPKSPVYHDANGDTMIFEEEKVNQARSCYMWVLSFAPKSVCGYETSPHLVHQFAEEFMAEMEAYQGLEFPAVIAVHMDKEHVHAHIVQSAFALDGHHKYLDTMETLNKAREISDEISRRYDLHVILEPENHRSMTHDEWKLVQEGKSWKENIRQEIAYNMERSKSFEEYLIKIRQSGYECRETAKGITYYTPGKTHRCRDIGLGAEYTKEAILAFYNEQPLEKHKQVQRDAVDIIDPTDPANQKAPQRIYVARYTQNGRRRTDLEMMFLKMLKIIKLFRDKFSDIDNTDNPIRKSADWKIQRLSEAISILDSYGIGTMKELDEKLLEVGAAHSHQKKDYNDVANNREGLEKLQDLLVNAKDLQMIADSLGVTDFYLTTPTKREIAANKATWFPMTSTQRRELFLALQEHPLYKAATKFDNMTYDEARDCIHYLKGKTDKMPAGLTTIIGKADNLEAKYQAIAEKTLESIRTNTEGKEISDKMKSMIESYNLPIDVKSLTFADAVHLVAYNKPWLPNFTPCTDDTLLATDARISQIKELLSYTGKEINIPVEQLSKKDADMIFRDITLGMITPDCLKAAYDKEWTSSLSSLSYEERGYVEDYREMLQTLEGLGYDAENINEVLALVTAQLENIQTEEQKLHELANEYKTLKRLKSLTDLSTVKQFSYGPKWRENFDMDIIEETIEKDPEPEEKTVEKEKETKRRTFGDDLTL